MCKITATNWNGKQIRVEAKTSITDLEKLAHKAHKAIKRAGYTTYRIDTINGIHVPYALAYC